ncbi:ATP-binding cassette domain-containing protein [Clostridium homopropionicum]|nr:ATP-binding cassette domain-containing protein [Clostridium homopropionicum]
MGLIKHSSGYVKIFDKSIDKSPKKIYSRVGSIIGVPGFYENLTGRENLEIMARLRGIHRADAVQYAIARLGIQESANKIAAQYSIEMKQRLGIAMSIMHEPELLILDEPTNGLDPKGVQEIRDLLISLRDEKGVTIIISSHKLNEIELFTVVLIRSFKQFFLGGSLLFLIASPAVFIAIKFKSYVHSIVFSAVITMINILVINSKYMALYPWSAVLVI